MHLWTIYDPDEMRELIEDYDVDGILTDYVADLDQVIREASRDQQGGPTPRACRAPMRIRILPKN